MVIAGFLTTLGAITAILSLLTVAPSTGESGTPAGIKKILIPIGGLIVLAVIGGVAVLLARRSMLAKDSAADPGGMLDDLRKMRDTGQISAEEFDAARKSIAAKLKGEPLTASARPPARRDNQTRPTPKTPN